MSAEKKLASTFPAKVHESSLPWCLRHHGSTPDIIDEARDIASFLCEATTERREGGAGIGNFGIGDWHNGLYMCFKLLIDKLETASGAYEFPAPTHDRNAPRLCRRIKDKESDHA